MSAPSPRPTRERLDALLATVATWGRALRYPDVILATETALDLAAEVRALRVELDARPRQCSCENAEETYRQLEHDYERVCEERDAALAARPPQPAAGDRVVEGGMAGTLERCSECSGDGLLHRPDPAELERFRAESPASQPAVPDGEDAAEQRTFLRGPTRLYRTEPPPPYEETPGAIAQAMCEPRPGPDAPTLPPCGTCWQPIDPAQPHTGRRAADRAARRARRHPRRRGAGAHGAARGVRVIAEQQRRLRWEIYHENGVGVIVTDLDTETWATGSAPTEDEARKVALRNLDERPSGGKRDTHWGARLEWKDPNVVALRWAWKEVEQLVGREWCTPGSTLDRVRWLVEQQSAREAEEGS